MHQFHAVLARHGEIYLPPSLRPVAVDFCASMAQGEEGAKISLAFSVRDKDALRKEVLTRAVEVAKENAATLASAAGVTLGKLMQMDYGWSEVRISDFLTWAEIGMALFHEFDAKGAFLIS